MRHWFQIRLSTMFLLVVIAAQQSAIVSLWLQMRRIEAQFEHGNSLREPILEILERREVERQEAGEPRTKW